MASEPQEPQYEEVRTVRDALGNEVVLTDDTGREQTFHIITELSLGGKHYCILGVSLKKSSEDDMIFEVQGSTADPELVSIEDEEEWELAAEAYDDWCHQKEADQ